MPLFKRRDPGKQPNEQPVSPPATVVLGQQDIFDRLEEEIVRADRYGRSLAMLCVLPQRITSESRQPRGTALATEAVVAHFDLATGRLDDGTRTRA